MIYLDNAATTPVCKLAIEETRRIYEEVFFNPSATYRYGVMVKKEIALAREKIAKLLDCNPTRLYFTSCASESNNWVFNSTLKNVKQNVVISAGEHASVFECAKSYKNKGFDVRIAPLNSDGAVNVDALVSLIDENTALVSTIHASNETGVVNDLSLITSQVKEKNPKTLVHSDGVQAFLKTTISIEDVGVDFYSISGHKVGAPKGVGLLYAKKNVLPLIIGGGQEGGFRSGTENVAGIVSLGVAAEEFAKLAKESDLNIIVDTFEKFLIDELGAEIVGKSSKRTGYITCALFSGTKAEILQTMCCDDNLIVGRGSACSSKQRGNRVLQEIGISLQKIDGALRFSYSPQTTKEDLESASKILKKNVNLLRGHRIG
jgi:cysteine desulfurase